MDSQSIGDRVVERILSASDRRLSTIVDIVNAEVRKYGEEELMREAVLSPRFHAIDNPGNFLRLSDEHYLNLDRVSGVTFLEQEAESPAFVAVLEHFSDDEVLIFHDGEPEYAALRSYFSPK